MGKIRGSDTVKPRKLADYTTRYFAKDQQLVRMKPTVKSKLLTKGMMNKRKKRVGGAERQRVMGKKRDS